MTDFYYTIFTEQELEEEEWKPAFGYELKYEVSNLGRVRRSPKGNIAPSRYRPAMVLKGEIDGHGYIRFTLYQNGTTLHRFAHSLVAETFLGQCPEDKFGVNHKDGKKINNRVQNLEWATSAENQQHAIRTGLRRTTCPPASEQIRKWLLLGHSFRCIAHNIGSTKNAVCFHVTSRAMKQGPDTMPCRRTMYLHLGKDFRCDLDSALHSA